MNVKEKVIIITGASGGLGAEIARVLSEHKAVVYLLDIAEEQGKALESELQQKGHKAYFIQMDITTEESWQKTTKDIYQKEGRIDVLVNNAGINIRKPLEEMVIEEWNTMMLVNTGSVFLACKYVIPFMRQQKGGAIINTSSVCGLVGHKYTPEA